MRWMSLLIALCLISCGNAGDKIAGDSYRFMPEREDLSPIRTDAESVVARLVSSHLKDGLVVSTREDGMIEHTGDSLLWSGIAMGSLPCSQAQTVVAAFSRMVKAYGSFVRFNPLPSEYEGREISNDGYIGAIFGFALHQKRCGATAKDVWAKHKKSLADWGGELYPNTGVKFPGVFEYAVNALEYKLELRHAPNMPDRYKLESAAVGWAKAVMLKKAACYRIHLATLLLIATDALGSQPSRSGKSAFCGVTSGSDLPLTDWLCGRRSALSYLSDHPRNAYEYRSQRCGYEKPDGDEGLETPWLDYILIHSLAAKEPL